MNEQELTSLEMSVGRLFSNHAYSLILHVHWKGLGGHMRAVIFRILATLSVLTACACPPSFSIEEAGDSSPGDPGSPQGPQQALPQKKHQLPEKTKKLLALRPDRIFPGHGTFNLSMATTCLQNLERSWNAPWQVTPRA